MKLFYYWLSLIFALNWHLSYCLTLKKLYHYQGTISDKIVLYFDKRPSYLSEPISSKDNLKKINILLPYASRSNKVKINKINKINKIKDGYSLNIQKTFKPVKSLNLEIEYNPKKIKFDYKSEIENLDNNLYALVLTFSDKDNLNLIKNKSCALRWLAMGKHQPRVVFDIKNQKCLRIIEALKDKLKNKNCETFTVLSGHLKNISKESIINTINLDYKPDIYIAFNSSKKNYILYSKENFIKSKFLKSKRLSYNLKYLLEKENKLKFKVIESNLAQDYILAATEMPSVYLSLNLKSFKSLNNISKAIAKLKL